MIIENKSKYRLVLSILLAAVVFGAAFLGWLWWKNGHPLSNNKSSYTIPGVPLVSVHNHKGQNALITSNGASAVVSVLEYWRPGENDFGDIGRVITESIPAGSFIDLSFLQDYFQRSGEYETKIQRMEPDDLNQYINSRVKTPLVFMIPIDKDQPAEVSYRAFRVLIGIDYADQKLIFHDFFLGNNCKVSFDEFSGLLPRMRPDKRNQYLVVQPKNLSEGLKKVKSYEGQSYPARTGIMERSGRMLDDYVLGMKALYINPKSDIAPEYFRKVTSNPDYEEYLPPFFRMRVYASLATNYLARGDNAQALDYAQKAMELNRDLDKPFKDFPGYEMGKNKPGFSGQSCVAPTVLADVYTATNDFEKAKANYEEAIKINPAWPAAQEGMQKLKLKMAAFGK